MKRQKVVSLMPDYMQVGWSAYVLPTYYYYYYLLMYYAVVIFIAYLGIKTKIINCELVTVKSQVISVINEQCKGGSRQINCPRVIPEAGLFRDKTLFFSND